MVFKVVKTVMDKNQSTRNSVDSRRKFLQKASAGIVIAAIPAKSSWAVNSCTVSGNLSNHASAIERNQDCTAVLEGRSPGFWKKIGKIKSQNNKYKSAGSVADVFGIATTNGDDVVGSNSSLEFKIKEVAGVIDNTNISLSANGYSSSFNLRTELNHWRNNNPNNATLETHLAACYLNTLYNLYIIPLAITPTEYLQSVFEQAAANGQQGFDDLKTAIEQTYHDGVQLY